MMRLVCCLAWLVLSSFAVAANPSQVAAGLQLFTHEFTSTPPGIHGDGLGPVFNEASCVACHNVGGVGGSGDARSNARAVGLSSAEFNPRSARANIGEAILSFSPGFVGVDGSQLASFTLHRRGGSHALVDLRKRSLSIFNPDWNDDSCLSPDTVHAERQPKQISNSTGELVLTTQVFARNTPPLFGAGLLNQIPDSLIWEQAKRQQRSSEISGRPGTLEDGRIGKFGWRANFATLLEFTETACANEIGLQTRRVKQVNDLTQPNYKNDNPDVSDEMIVAMNSFIESLPKPSRAIPQGGRALEKVNIGNKRFEAIGCIDCHTANMGALTDVYSDLLLHDMGPYSIDLAAAPPYRRKISLVEEVKQINPSTTLTSDLSQTSTGGYSGSVSTMSTASTVSATAITRTGPASGRVTLIPPSVSPRQIIKPLNRPASVKTVDFDVTTQAVQFKEFSTQKFSVSDIEPTFVNQEWKTPPLWGVKDSAPYMHDGRAETILEAIAMHDGEARGSRNRFFALSFADQDAILAFLDTFAAPTDGVIQAPKKFTRRDLVRQ